MQHIKRLTILAKRLAPPILQWLFLLLVGLAWVYQLPKDDSRSPPPVATDAPDDPVPPATLTVSKDGNSIVVSGLIGNRTQPKFDRLLDEHPSVKVVELRSAGGRVGESLRVARDVAKRGLSTYVATECSSTCTAILLSGSIRTAAVGAKIGFHGTRKALDRTSAASNGGDELLRAFYREAGLSPEFIDRIFSTSPATIWFPSVDQLVQQGVLTSANAAEAR